MYADCVHIATINIGDHPQECFHILWSAYVTRFVITGESLVGLAVQYHTVWYYCIVGITLK